MHCMPRPDLVLSRSFFTGGRGGKGGVNTFQVNKGGQKNFFQSANRILSANSWAHSAITNPQISQVCQSQDCKFVMINPLISTCASPHIENPQICNKKSSVSDPDPHWIVSNAFFYLRKYILDYQMPCNSVSKLSQKPKVVLKFLCDLLSLSL